jgi:hypothetical protein
MCEVWTAKGNSTGPRLQIQCSRNCLVKNILTLLWSRGRAPSCWKKSSCSQDMAWRAVVGKVHLLPCQINLVWSEHASWCYTNCNSWQMNTHVNCLLWPSLRLFVQPLNRNVTSNLVTLYLSSRRILFYGRSIFIYSHAITVGCRL